MNIVVIARTLNEEDYVERFLRGYEWADTILFADGGSTDKTLALASKHPKVHIVTFDQRAATQDGGWCNPENAHANFLFDEAAKLNPDWLVMDDLDCVPNYLLREQARTILENELLSEVYAYRLYMWLKVNYFPALMVGKSLWAWKPSEITIRARPEKDPFDMEYTQSNNFSNPRNELELPLCLLHDCWPTLERVNQKMKRYASWGRPQIYPTDACGRLEKLPEYAHE